MSVEHVVEELQRLGMSGYEAKAYVALVAGGAALNGYEVAKRSGVPRSTVYETLGKLVGRGAAFEVRGDDDAVGYVALPPEVLLERMRREFDATVTSLNDSLTGLHGPEQARLVHPLTDRASLVQRALDVVATARLELFVSGWPQELVDLNAALRGAEERGVRVAKVVFGSDADPVGWTTEHRWSAPDAVEADLGRRMLVVTADRDAAVVGGLAADHTRGLYTDDPATVMLAVEYVRHDIALHLVADRYAGAGFAEFWASDPSVARLRRPLEYRAG
ncbi:TrmB family transcriptional regulator [Pseudonocardia phyllosphaerae]|uniref:TrmB family transcriptional regulator n=1 Tax=Pseudonocardia phyllosphaerae TaxID=3390502 RepID=UPI003979801B